MNKHPHIDIIIAWFNGELVQYQHCSGAWVDYPFYDPNKRMGPVFNPAVKYRLKPEPREFWLMFNAKDQLLGTFKTKNEADSVAAYTLNAHRVLHFREVMPE